MAYVRRRNKGEHPKLDMTPMIDVVFQLLIFFVVTLKQEDILSKLSAARPAPDPTAKPEKQLETINIIVAPQGFLLNGRPMRKEELDRQIGQFAAISTTAMVVVRCTADSPHAFLVQALDICNKHKMSNLSIFSM
jgi:biopolymer transport protein ExbD